MAREGDADAYRLLNERLPKMRAKLNRLDAKIVETLREIREVFPDAEYYTASGGFHLLLGKSHDHRDIAQQQRMAWFGNAQIGDGDW